MSRRNPKWTAFGVAAGLLLVATIAWQVTADWLDLALQKEPVPWPKGVEVDPVGFRNLTLPDQFGPPVRDADGKVRARFTKVTGDGVLDRRTVKRPDGTVVSEPVFDGQPDGEILYRKDMLESLDIGSALDEARVDDRRSNWYVQRIYRDNTVHDPRSPYRYWRLDVVYYTGGAVTVPHVPDICVLASGATPGERLVHSIYPAPQREQLASEVEVGMLAPAPQEWFENGKFVSLAYSPQESMGNIETVQYYLFSYNGHPMTDRNRVRLKMGDIWQRYVYYSKVQFLPLAYVPNRAEADAKAADFLRHALPAVLTQLPSAEDVDALESPADSGR